MLRVSLSAVTWLQRCEMHKSVLQVVSHRVALTCIGARGAGWSGVGVTKAGEADGGQNAVGGKPAGRRERPGESELAGRGNVEAISRARIGRESESVEIESVLL